MAFFLIKKNLMNLGTLFQVEFYELFVANNLKKGGPKANCFPQRSLIPPASRMYVWCPAKIIIIIIAIYIPLDITPTSVNAFIANNLERKIPTGENIALFTYFLGGGYLSFPSQNLNADQTTVFLSSVFVGLIGSHVISLSTV